MSTRRDAKTEDEFALCQAARQNNVKKIEDLLNKGTFIDVYVRLSDLQKRNVLPKRKFVKLRLVCEERERKKLNELVGRERRENVILV